MDLSPDWEVIGESKTARLILEDESVFEGYLFGACRSSPGEVGKLKRDRPREMVRWYNNNRYGLSYTIVNV